MTFTAASYQIANERIIEQIKETHDWQETEGFIADGVISPEEYAKQSTRILCILAESYGYDGNGVTEIQNQPKDDLMGVSEGSVKTPRLVASLLWLIFQSLDTGSKTTWEEIPWLLKNTDENIAIHQKTLSRIAWINVKKASRADGTDMVSEEIWDHGRRNKSILAAQIEACAPDLVIVCGPDALGVLSELNLFGPGVSRGLKGKIQATEAGLSVVELPHPGYYRAWGYEGIYEMFESIYDQWITGRTTTVSELSSIRIGTTPCPDAPSI